MADRKMSLATSPMMRSFPRIDIHGADVSKPFDPRGLAVQVARNADPERFS